MKRILNRGKALFGATLVAIWLVAGCGNSDNFVFTNTVNNNPVSPVPQPPLAVNDAFNALGNATLNQAAPGVLANDTLNGGQISAFDAMGSQGGVINLNADGSFTYTPVMGFVGTETFTYTLTNADGDSTATATLTSTGLGLFVDNTAPDGGTGTQTDPFDMLADAAGVAQSGDVIYVARGDGTNMGMTGGINLPAGVKLIGEGTGLILAQLIVPAGQAPTIEGPINCGGDNVIQGLTIDGSASELVQITDVGNVTVSDCTLANPTEEHIQAVGVSGQFVVTNNTFQSPPNSNFDLFNIDNSASNVTTTAAITDNTFTNSMDNDVDWVCDITTGDNGSMSVDFSRNTANGMVLGEFDFGFRWDNEEHTSAATLTCQENLFNNVQGHTISAYDVDGAISGNMLTNINSDAIECTLANQTLTVSGNTLTNVNSAIYVLFNIDGANGTFIVDNNNIDTGNSGITVEYDENNNARVAIRNNTVTNSGGRSLEANWHSRTSDLCMEVVGNTFSHDLRFDANVGPGTINIERRDQLASINTVGPPGVVDLQDGTVNALQGACMIP